MRNWGLPKKQRHTAKRVRFSMESSSGVDYFVLDLPTAMDASSRRTLQRRRGVLRWAHVGGQIMSERSTVLLGAPSEGVEAADLPQGYGKVAEQCAAESVDYPGYLLRLSELELIDRHHRMVDRRIKAARFPATRASAPSTSWPSRS